MFTWIHADHLSSATRITDAAGLEIRRLVYAAFGEEAENQGTGDEPKYKYTGKEHDATGLYYYGARYYDPALSRFITADTIYDAGPQGLNRYSYALNNPIIYRDPTGQYVSGPNDSQDPDDYGCITGSQDQFADGTATVHIGSTYEDVWRRGMALDEYDAGGEVFFPLDPRKYKPPYRQVKSVGGCIGPCNGAVERFLYSGWAGDLADIADKGINTMEKFNLMLLDIDTGVEAIDVLWSYNMFNLINKEIYGGASAYVDLLRVGEGCPQGAWGCAKDGIRIVALTYSGTKVLRKIGVGGAYGSGRGYQWKKFMDVIEKTGKGPIKSAMTPTWTKAYNFIQGLPGPLKKVGMKVFETVNLAYYTRATKLYTYGEYAGGFGAKEEKIVRFVGGVIEHIVQ